MRPTRRICGCGRPLGVWKSTLLYCLAGLEPVSEGSVALLGREITRMGRNRLARLRRAHVGFVFQAYNLVPALNAIDNVALPGWLNRNRGARERAKVALQTVGLEEFARTLPERLSGGQQQRVAIARALASDAEIIFADEPTGALDSASGAVVLDRLRRLVDHDGRTVVMVTHDLEAASIADRVLVMRDGLVRVELTAPSSETILSALRDSAPARVRS